MFKDKFPKDFNIFSDLKTHYFMSYSTNKEKLYTHSATLNNNFLKDLKSQVEEKYDLPLDTFETEKEVDDKVYTFSEEDKVGLKFYKEILTMLKINATTPNEPGNIIKQATKIPTPSNLKFIISHFQTATGDNILIFTKQDRIGVPNKKRAWKYNGKDDFNVVDLENIYLFNSFPTCIFINENIYVIDYKGFIEIFGFKQHLEKHVDEVREMLEDSGIISNMPTYKDSFKQYRYFNALTKIPNDSQVVSKFIKSNAPDIKKITSEYEVHFEFDSSKHNFRIQKEEGIKILVRLLSDRAGFNLAKDFITYPSRESIKRKPTPTVKKKKLQPKKSAKQ
ncbi:MAG: Kiwa anti-phage protein KwaB-like domain-containing protein [Solibacillus sp.]